VAQQQKLRSQRVNGRDTQRNKASVYGVENDLEMEEDEEKSKTDMEIAMGKMAHGKATGEDELLTEMIKGDGSIEYQWFYEV
jgi:hypothetical protein